MHRRSPRWRYRNQNNEQLQPQENPDVGFPSASGSLHSGGCFICDSIGHGCICRDCGRVRDLPASV